MNETINDVKRIERITGGKAAYIFDREAFEKNFNDITSAFESEYGLFKIAYSFKTNYLKAICTGVKDLGGMAEVVSPYEYQYAKALGFADSRIVYNGVIPDPAGKYEAALNGAKVNVDNIEEYKAISREAALKEKAVVLGVRVNIDIGNGLTSRFGVDADGDELAELMKLINKDTHVSFGGFHVHIGFGKPVRFWEEKAKKMVALAKKYSPEYIDLGGGLFGIMPEFFAKQFAEYPGDFVQYAKATARLMKEAFPDERILLMIEPGTALVGNTFAVMAKVTEIKKIKDKHFIIMNCNSNQLGFASDTKKLYTEVFNVGTGSHEYLEDAIVAGNTCIDKDYVVNGISCKVGIGDLMVFHNVGAYSLSPSRQFIVPRLGVYDKDTGSCLLEGSGFKEMFQAYLAAE